MEWLIITLVPFRPILITNHLDVVIIIFDLSVLRRQLIQAIAVDHDIVVIVIEAALNQIWFGRSACHRVNLKLIDFELLLSQVIELRCGVIMTCIALVLLVIPRLALAIFIISHFFSNDYVQ